MIYHLEDGNVHRAGDRAMSAAYAEIYAKAFLIINELMHRPLPPAAILGRTGIVSACFKRKIHIVAGIIAFIPHPGILDLFIGDFKAMAGRTNKRAGITAHTISRSLFKSR